MWASTTFTTPFHFCASSHWSWSQHYEFEPGLSFSKIHITEKFVLSFAANNFDSTFCSHTNSTMSSTFNLAAAHNNNKRLREKCIFPSEHIANISTMYVCNTSPNDQKQHSVDNITANANIHLFILNASFFYPNVLPTRVGNTSTTCIQCALRCKDEPLHVGSKRTQFHGRWVRVFPNAWSDAIGLFTDVRRRRRGPHTRNVANTKGVLKVPLSLSLALKQQPPTSVRIEPAVIHSTLNYCAEYD